MMTKGRSGRGEAAAARACLETSLAAGGRRSLRPLCQSARGSRPPCQGARARSGRRQGFRLGFRPAERPCVRAATGTFLSMRLPVPPLGATMITTSTAAMLGAVVAVVAGGALALAVLPPAHAAAGEPGTLIFSFGERGFSGPYEFSGITDVDVGPDGKIIVLDVGVEDSLRVFHPNGTLYFATDVGPFIGWTDGVYAAPDGKIIVRNGGVYHVFHPNGTSAFSFETGLGNHDLHFAPNGDFVVRENATSVAVFRNYTHAYSFGEPGLYYGEFTSMIVGGMSPDGKIIAVDVDINRHHGEAFHLNGTHAYSFGPFEGIQGMWHDIGPTGEILIGDGGGGFYYRSPSETLNLFYPNGVRAAILPGISSTYGMTGAFAPDGTIVAKIAEDPLSVYQRYQFDQMRGWRRQSFMQCRPGRRPTSPRRRIYRPWGRRPTCPSPRRRPQTLAAAAPAFEFGSYGEGPGRSSWPRITSPLVPAASLLYLMRKTIAFSCSIPTARLPWRWDRAGRAWASLHGPHGLAFGPQRPPYRI